MKVTTKLIGLIGYPLEHSLSERYFNEKFSRLGYDFIEYRNFPLEDIEELPELLDLFPEICGLNVTSPHKRSVIKFLNEIDPVAKQVGSVNTIMIRRGQDTLWLKGYNTDVNGFEKSFVPLLEPHHRAALILGTGGAARAVAYVLGKLGIEYRYVSRSFKQEDAVLYSELDKVIMERYKIIINATPLGMYPDINLYPPIPYDLITGDHLLYDLIYNPPVTRFLEFGQNKGAKVSNGLMMLYEQADASWEIFRHCGCVDSLVCWGL